MNEVHEVLTCFMNDDEVVDVSFTTWERSEGWEELRLIKGVEMTNIQKPVTHIIFEFPDGCKEARVNFIIPGGVITISGDDEPSSQGKTIPLQQCRRINHPKVQEARDERAQGVAARQK